MTMDDREEEEEDELTLSKEAMRALHEFMQEAQAAQSKLLSYLPSTPSSASSDAQKEFLRIKDLQIQDFGEDWQLSQFWYSQSTGHKLAQEVLDQTDKGDKIACLSCPSAFFALKDTEGFQDRCIQIFEFDKRFDLLGNYFVFYDFNFPLNLDKSLQGSFDYILVDPPFLSDECWTKTSQTVKWLSKPTTKILCCTGAIMKQKVEEELNCKETNFDPEHAGGLANEFRSYISYTSNQFSKRD